MIKSEKIKIITIDGVDFYVGDIIEYYTNKQASLKGDRRVGKLVWNEIGYSPDTRIGFVDAFEWHTKNPSKIEEQITSGENIDFKTNKSQSICYHCLNACKEIYQIKVIDKVGDVSFEEVCSENCAKKAQQEIYLIHKQRADDVRNCLVQKIWQSKISPGDVNDSLSRD